MSAPPTKTCETCGKLFPKPPSCGIPEWNSRRRFCSYPCKAKAQLGKPSGKTGWRSPLPSVATFIPCRICGAPTRYPGNRQSSLFKRVRCDKSDCVERSRMLKNKRIRAAKLTGYRQKRTKKRNYWALVERISQEEKDLRPHLEPLGWQPQFLFITGVSAASGLPRCFWLDFAFVTMKLCVEIDGSSHRIKSEKDTRRDEMLRERGWAVFRIPSAQVRTNIDEVISSIFALSKLR